MRYSELFKILASHGWYEVRRKGSHVIMRNDEKGFQLIVPDHGSKEVKKGMASGLLKKAGIKTTKR
jgi:mRNA interferase HicA